MTGHPYHTVVFPVVPCSEDTQTILSLSKPNDTWLCLLLINSVMICVYSLALSVTDIILQPNQALSSTLHALHAMTQTLHISPQIEYPREAKRHHETATML